jgi:D-alanyl-D-alanine carboxypeptidase/D-alanyl-D-alanine-endopeptidase (penicillin-binding protein 4)
MKRGRRKFYAATFSPLHSVSKFIQHGLRRRGIDVGPARFAEGDEAAPEAAATIYQHVSPFSLADVILETNLNSNNYYAEHLLKTLGAEFEGEGSFDAGVRAVRRAVSLLDVPLVGYQQLDGSGLARSDYGGNTASPRTIVSLLEAMAQHPRGAPFVASLAVGGISGTLEHRFEEPPLQGKVFAKTGRIQGSLALSGYLALDDVPVVAFSILANHEAEGTFALRQQVYEFHDAVLQKMWSHLNEIDHDWTAPPTIVKALAAHTNGFPPVE